MAEEEYEKIIKLITEENVPFETFEHIAVRTSAEAAIVRGAEIKQGVKALVIKFKRSTGDFFAVCDIPADRKLDWKKAKIVFKATDARMATEEEVVEHTNCQPGGVPPFGHGKTLGIIVDPHVFDEETLEFNAGLKTKSVRIKSRDLKKVFEKIGVAYFDLTL